MPHRAPIAAESRIDEAPSQEDRRSDWGFDLLPRRPIDGLTESRRTGVIRYLVVSIVQANVNVGRRRNVSGSLPRQR